MGDTYRHLGGGGTMSGADFALYKLRNAVEAEKHARDGSHAHEIVSRFEELEKIILETGELPEDWRP
jgi:hypothetical protein